MTSKRIWNLCYIPGNPATRRKVITYAGSPMLRYEALAGARKIADNGWRVWVEHKDTHKRIFESAIEKEYRAREQREGIALLRET